MGLKDLFKKFSSKKEEEQQPVANFDEQEFATQDEEYYTGDTRTRHELFPYFKEIYSRAEFAGYEIMTKVPATSFGANPLCAPVDFLFKKNGRAVLAVMVISPAGWHHGAVTSVRQACESKNICVINFVEGYANKEDYIIDRTLQYLNSL